LTYQTFVWYKKSMGKTPVGQTREHVYRFVRERLLQGAPPTIREVQRAFGFRAVETARAHLEALVAEGRLGKRRGRRARGYLLPEPVATLPFSPALVPLLGRVQAGALSTAIEDLEGYVPVETRRSGEELFALRVRGESMSGAAILHGDLVIVRRQASAESGDIVVALVDDEATVKRLRIRGSRVELHPENPDFDPIVPESSNVKLLGKVIEVRRYLGTTLPLRKAIT
jgi:repressor LexA